MAVPQPPPLPTPLQYKLPIVDPKTGLPTPQFQKQWQTVIDHLANIEGRLTAAGI